MVAPLFVKKTLPEEPGTARQRTTVLQSALLQNTVVLQGPVLLVSNDYDYIYLVTVIFSVFCYTYSDCSTVLGYTVCKESVTGGPLTCQPSSSCLSVPGCNEDEYCSTDNTCLAASTGLSLPINLDINTLSQSPALAMVTVVLAWSARRQLLVEQRLVRQVKPALRHVVKGSSVMQQISANLVFTILKFLIPYPTISCLCCII